MTTALPPRRLSVAPMLDWTDRHCRYFHRLITKHTWLYTEMVTTGAILFGQTERHLRFNEIEHPLALQLGGSEPEDLARCAKLAQEWGYDEVNLNCGCPSERVQRGAFGACLMAEPSLVADCFKAMQDQVDIPVTIKHRIGIDHQEDYAFVRDFVGTLAEAGCRTFIVHARNAILKGLSPKENREIPPLKYDYAWQLKRDFPDLEIIVNGGIKTLAQIDEQLQHVDGVMIGREAYHNPWLMVDFDRLFYPELNHADESLPTRAQVLSAMVPYVQEQLALFGNNGQGLRLNSIIRHLLGIANGMQGARAFRQMLSDSKRLALGDANLLLSAWALVEAEKLS